MLRVICLLLNLVVLVSGLLLATIAYNRPASVTTHSPGRPAVSFDDLVPSGSAKAPENPFDRFDPPTQRSAGLEGALLSEPVLFVIASVLIGGSVSAIWIALFYSRDGSLWSLYLARKAAEQRAKIRALEREARDA